MMSEVNKKTYTLNINNFLQELDVKNYKMYENLPNEDKKSISPLVIMRWLSSCWDNDLAKYYAFTVNDYVNKYFWDLSGHKDLQMKLLAMCGMGRPAKHNWIKSKKVKNDKLLGLIKKYFGCDDDEADVYMSKMNNKDIEDILIFQGIDEKEWSKYLY